jgi:thiol:disulfide interchange protein
MSSRYSIDIPNAVRWGLRRFLPIAGIFALAVTMARGEGVAPGGTPPPSVEWEGWSVSLFDKADQENKLVLLNLRAGWSPASEAMDARTYTDARVIEALRSHYIAVSADADARPDFAAHYQDGGLPATIIFASDGTEIARRNGFLTAQALEALLQKIANDPSAGSSAAPELAIHPTDTDRLTDDLRKKL